MKAIPKNENNLKVKITYRYFLIDISNIKLKDMLTLPEQRDIQLQGEDDFSEQGEVTVHKKKTRKVELMRFIVVSSVHQTVDLKKSYFAKFSHFCK